MKSAGHGGEGTRNPMHRLWDHGKATDRAVAELAGVVRPPTLHRAVTDQRARMLAAGLNRGGVYQPIGCDRVRRAVQRVIANLSLVIPAHAAHRLIGEPHASVPVTARDCDRN